MILKFNNPMLKLEHIKIFSISVFKKLLINVISNEFENPLVINLDMHDFIFTIVNILNNAFKKRK